MIEQGAVRVHLEGLRASLSRRAILLAGAINIKLPEGLPLTLPLINSKPDPNPNTNPNTNPNPNPNSNPNPKL